MSLCTKATRKQSRYRLAIAGPSGSGKTTYALVCATVLAGGEVARSGSRYATDLPDGKVAVIGTEKGSASLCADQFNFDVLKFSAPYSPAVGGGHRLRRGRGVGGRCHRRPDPVLERHRWCVGDVGVGTLSVQLPDEGRRLTPEQEALVARLTAQLDSETTPSSLVTCALWSCPLDGWYPVLAEGTTRVQRRVVAVELLLCRMHALAWGQVRGGRRV